MAAARRANSTGALNTNTLAWLRKHNGRLDDLLLARGYTAAVDRGVVSIQMSSVRPAVSYLQLLLVFVAVVVALLSYAVANRYTTGHYKSSLLGILVATTADEDQPTSNRKPHYFRRGPTLNLSMEGARGVLGTDSGIYRLDQSAAKLADADSTQMSDTFGVNNLTKLAKCQEFRQQKQQVASDW
jgi:hypothetical protein